MKPIYDTMNGGLTLDSTDKITFENISTLPSKEGVFHGTQKVNGKSIDFKYGYKATRTRDALSISLYNGPNDDEWFTTFTVSCKESKNNRFVNIKANGTALTNFEYAIRPSADNVISTLTAPFFILDDIYRYEKGKAERNIFSSRTWDRIETGDIALQDLEIAFPWDCGGLDKQAAIRMLACIYRREFSLDGRHITIAPHLHIRASLYPEIMTDFDQPFTGFMLQKFDAAHRILTLNVYDKIEQMKDTGRKIPDDMPKVWHVQPRFDIRFFRRELQIILKQHGINTITVAGWAKFHDTLGSEKLKMYCLERALDRLHFFDLTKNVEDMVSDLKKHKDFFANWKKSIFLPNVSANAHCDENVKAVFKKYNTCMNIGGLAYNIVDHASRETAADINDLIANRVSQKVHATHNKEYSDIPARQWFAKFQKGLKKDASGLLKKQIMQEHV